MIFERYIDLQVGRDEYLENVKIETDIPTNDIYTISPMLTKYGAKYKNITLLEDRYGNQYKVKGNYKEFINILRREKIDVKGFAK